MSMEEITEGGVYIMDSILNYVKKRIGIPKECDDFDPDIIGAVNLGFSTLVQLGAGPKTGFWIEDENAEWSDYLDESDPQQKLLLGFIKEYLYIKARLSVDIPTSSILVEVLERNYKELEVRIKDEIETPSIITEQN